MIPGSHQQRPARAAKLNLRQKEELCSQSFSQQRFLSSFFFSFHFNTSLSSPLTHFLNLFCCHYVPMYPQNPNIPMSNSYLSSYMSLCLPKSLFCLNFLLFLSLPHPTLSYNGAWSRGPSEHHCTFPCNMTLCHFILMSLYPFLPMSLCPYYILFSLDIP